MASNTEQLDKVTKEKEVLEKENRELKRNLKTESKERDILEKEAFDLERKVKQYERKITQLEQDILQESKERDTLDQENASLNKDIRKLEQEIKNQKLQYSLLDDEVTRLKDNKSKLNKRIEELEREHEKELDKLKDELRAGKRELREKTRKLEIEKEEIERELKRSQNKRQASQLVTLERDLQAANEKIKLLRSQTVSSTGKVDDSVINELLEEKNQLQTSRDKAVNDVTKINGQLDLLKKEKEITENTKKELEDELKQIKSKLTTQSTLTESIEKSKSEIEEQLNNLKKLYKENEDVQVEQKRKLEQQINELQTTLQHEIDLKKEEEEQIEYLQQEIVNYQVSIADLETNLQELESDKGKLTIEIHQLKSKLTQTDSNSNNTESKTNMEVINKMKLLETELLEIKENFKKEQQYKENAVNELQQLKNKTKETDLNLEKKLDEIVAKEKKVTKQLEQTTTELNEERDKNNNKIKLMEQEYKKLQSKIDDEITKNKQNEKEKNRIDKLINEITTEKESIKNKLENEIKNRIEIENKLIETKQALENENRESNKLKRSVSQFEEEQSKIDQLNTIRIDLEKEKRKLETEIIELKNQLTIQSENNEKLQKQIEQIQQQTQKNNKEQTTTEEKRELEKKITEITLQLEEANDDRKRWESAKNRFQLEIEDLKEELEEEKEVADNAEKIKKRLMYDKSQLEEQLDEELKQRQEEIKLKIKLQRENEALQQTINDIKQNLTKEQSDSSSKLDQLQLERNNLEKKLNTLENEIKQLQDTITSKERKETQIEKESSSLKNELQNIQTQSKQIQEQLQEKQKENESIQVELAKLKKQIANTPAPTTTVITTKDTEEINHLKSENKTLKNEIETLKTLIEQLKQQNSKLLERETEEETETTQETNNNSNSNSSSSNVGARLSVPRRVAPARSGKKAPTSTIGNTITTQAESDNTTTSPRKEINVAAMGGINMFGGITADLLKQKPKLTTTGTTGVQTPSDNKSRLWAVKGRRRIRSYQVELTYKSLNKGDVFILETPTVIFQWNGSECNRLERTKGKDITSRMLRQRASTIMGNSKPDVITLDEDDNEEEQMFNFWKEIGGKGEIAPASSAPDDLQIENYLDTITKLYSVKDNGDIEPIDGKLVIEMLDSNSCFLLDCKNEIYVWIGKNSTKELRSISMSKANELMENGEQRSKFTEIYRVSEGGESVFFCEKFTNWPDGATLGPQKYVSNVAKSKQQEKIDVIKMHNVEPPVTSNQLDDITGNVTIWIVNDAIKQEQPVDLYGQFWCDNSYVILYTYGSDTDPSYLVYYWLGVNCTKNEKGTCAALALNLAKKHKGASQVRLTPNKEPVHFLRLFHGNYVVHRGNQRNQTNDTRLYCIKGNNDSDTITFQVENKATSLNSNFSYLLITSNDSFIWTGNYSNKWQQDVANQIAKVLNINNISTIKENNENDKWWSALGGKMEYYKEENKHKVKCFQFSNATGMVTAEPIWKYTQEELTNDSIFALDTYHSIYLWIGSKARENEKKIAMETCLDYVENAKDGRPKTTQVLTIKEGQEPLSFITHFHGWFAPIKAGVTNIESVSDSLKQYSQTYSYEQLKDKDTLPKTVDKGELEKYLSDEDFEKVFSMTKEAWSKVPGWKKGPIKKQVGLF